MSEPVESVRVDALGSLWVIVGGAIVVFVLGLVGYATYLPDSTVWDVLFSAMNLLSLNFQAVDGVAVPWTLEVARILVHVVAGVAVVATVASLARRGLDRRRAQHWRGHVVVVGSSPHAVMVAESYRHRGVRVVVVGDPGEGPRLLLQRRGVRVIEAEGELLGRVVAGASRVVVIGASDDETVSLGSSLPRRSLERVDRVQLLIDRPALALELERGWKGRGAMIDVSCVSQRVAAGVLRDYPPEDERMAAPPAVVVGQGPLAEELARRLVRGWWRPADPVRVLLLSPQAWLADELSEELEGLGRIDGSRGSWSERRVALQVQQHTQESWPAPGRRPMREVQGPLVVVAGLTDADAVTLGARIARTVVAARVVVLLSQVSGWDDLRDGELARGAILRLIPVHELMSDPAVLETDRARLVAWELFADQHRWRDDVPSVFGDDVRRVGSFDRLDEQQRRRFDVTASAALQACEQLGFVAGRTAGADVVLLPEELFRIVEQLRQAAAQVPEMPRGDEYLWLEFAARLPALLARAGVDLARGSEAPVVFGEQQVRRLAPLAHQCYLDTQYAAGNLTGSQVAGQSWEQLSEFHRESNRDQVRDLPVKLAAVGRTLCELEDGNQPDRSWLTEEVVDTLGIWEHRRWEYLHRLAGYEWGDETDHQARIHSMLIPWDELDGAKLLDRAVVQAIPDMLAAVGLDTRPITVG